MLEARRTSAGGTTARHGAVRSSARAASAAASFLRERGSSAFAIERMRSVRLLPGGPDQVRAAAAGALSRIAPAAGRYASATGFRGSPSPTEAQIATSAHAASLRIRRLVLEEAKRAGVGHVGSALSVADIVAALYFGAMRVEAPDDPDRDRMVMSKGHAALTLYAALHLRGWIDRDELATYCSDGAVLGTHPEHVVPGIDFCTGSLGHGLSIGTGAALAARLRGSGRRVYVLLSDAECNAGAVWEAAMFAAHHRIGNLVAIVDRNGQQALGYTRDVLDLEPLADRWAAFGWDAIDVDGHDADALVGQLLAEGRDGRPRVLVARTTLGKGASFMEGRVEWHYWPLSDDQYATALAELERSS